MGLGMILESKIGQYNIKGFAAVIWKQKQHFDIDSDDGDSNIPCVPPKKGRFFLEAYISASRVLNDKTKTTIGKVFQRAFQNSPW